jgi:hypothetical protein
LPSHRLLQRSARLELCTKQEARSRGRTPPTVGMPPQPPLRSQAWGWDAARSPHPLQRTSCHPQSPLPPSHLCRSTRARGLPRAGCSSPRVLCAQGVCGMSTRRQSAPQSTAGCCRRSHSAAFTCRCVWVRVYRRATFPSLARFPVECLQHIAAHFWLAPAGLRKVEELLPALETLVDAARAVDSSKDPLVRSHALWICHEDRTLRSISRTYTPRFHAVRCRLDLGRAVAPPRLQRLLLQSPSRSCLSASCLAIFSRPQLQRL